MECLPVDLIGHQNTPMLLLVGVAVDSYPSSREIRGPIMHNDIRRLANSNCLGTGKSFATLGGQDTPPRNAAQFKVPYTGFSELGSLHGESE